MRQGHSESVAVNNVVAGSYAAVNYIFGNNGYTLHRRHSGQQRDSHPLDTERSGSSSTDQGYIAGLLRGSNTFTATAARNRGRHPYKSPLASPSSRPSPTRSSGPAVPAAAATPIGTRPTPIGAAPAHNTPTVASVTFTDSGINTNITIAAAVQPAGLAFSNPHPLHLRPARRSPAPPR